MYEFFLSLKYLIPKRRSLSTALISVMSIFVISLVVWLILVFLSVTTGIEKNWLKKLTALNAPMRITPSEEYYRSYYYQIDKISAQANFSEKTIGEKLKASLTDPYSPDEDIELPHYWPKPQLDAKGAPKDLVKDLYQVLKEKKDLSFGDFEVSGALMRLALYRSSKNEFSFLNNEKTSFISQMTYLLSLTENNPNFSSLYLQPEVKDLNNLLFKLDKDSSSIQEDSPNFKKKISNKNIIRKNFHRFFSNVKIKKLISNNNFLLPLSFLSKDETFIAYAFLEGTKITKLTFDQNHPGFFEKGEIFFSPADKAFFFKSAEGKNYHLNNDLMIKLNTDLIFEADLVKSSINTAKELSDIQFSLKGFIQNKPIGGVSSFDNLTLFEAEPITSFSLKKPLEKPFWPYEIKGLKESKIILPSQKEKGVLLPKSLKDSGVLIGDKGYFSYMSKTALSMQEQRIPIYIAGFYDPGILSVGNRCVIVPDEITKTIFATNAAFTPDGIPTNGVFVWTKDLKNIDTIKRDIQVSLKKEGLAPYWEVQTYKDYEFSKDLMLQFQSDRLLFTLIAIIIIIVACSNIISLLVLLVNDKKKEIAVLQAMGAPKKNIALIFGSCGVIMGFLSSLIGSITAIFTLKHLDALVSFLSFIQGHAAFNVAFFGDKLPNVLSVDAVIFVLIVTPFISLAAGLIPAIKACQLNPSQILRAD